MKISKYKIKDIAKIYNGSTPSSDHPEFYNGDIIWFTPKDLSDQRIKYIEKGERSITKAGYDSCSTIMIPAGNILMSSRAPIGLLAINKFDCCTNQGFKNLVVNKERADVEYLYYLLEHNVEYLKRLGGGTTFSEISKSTLEEMQIFLPELSEQKRIAKVLTDIDSKIAVNKKINKELEVMAKELYDYWFVQFDFPGSDGKPYKSSGGKMVYNEVLKREIPEGWEVKKVENVMNVNRGGSPRPIDDYISDCGLHWLKISDATASSSPFILNTKEYILESGLKKTVLMKAGSIVLSNSATPGMPRILDIDTCIHDGWLYFSKTELSNEFLYLFFLKMRENIVKLANGSIFLNLKTDVVKDFKMVLPTKAILQQFDDVIKPIFSQMLNLEKEQVRLSKMRDELLPLLMNGQVSVK